MVGKKSCCYRGSSQENYIINKRIGILGGISYESTKQYYDLIHKRYYDRKHDYYFPEVVVFSLNFQKFTDYENSNTEQYIEYILEGIRGLEAARVDCIILAANSPHSVYTHLTTQTPLPIYSISDATIKKAKELKLTQLLLLGIKHTMDSEFYPESGMKNDIDVLVPTEEEKRIIDDIIFSELCGGLDPSPNYKKKRREVIVQTFGRVIELGYRKCESDTY